MHGVSQMLIMAPQGYHYYMLPQGMAYIIIYGTYFQILHYAS